ncbi:MAG: hypothetical protein J7L32_06815 [Thermoplasmata archaeon]|nr:hypothetical protein [Thermoplasmata archaeon]HHH79840.1 hypothetical protein [Thermoplasmatales archaeon]
MGAKSSGKEIHTEEFPYREDMERLVNLLLKMIFIGFDELEMQERVEAIELFGEKLRYGVSEVYNRLASLEERVEMLEKNL